MWQGHPDKLFQRKLRELEMEGARISWDELTCVGYPVSENVTEKLCRVNCPLCQGHFELV